MGRRSIDLGGRSQFQFAEGGNAEAFHLRGQARFGTNHAADVGKQALLGQSGSIDARRGQFSLRGHGREIAVVDLAVLRQRTAQIAEIILAGVQPGVDSGFFARPGKISRHAAATTVVAMAISSQLMRRNPTRRRSLGPKTPLGGRRRGAVLGHVAARALGQTGRRGNVFIFLP